MKGWVGVNLAAKETFLEEIGVLLNCKKFRCRCCKCFKFKPKELYTLSKEHYNLSKEPYFETHILCQP